MEDKDSSEMRRAALILMEMSRAGETSLGRAGGETFVWGRTAVRGGHGVRGKLIDNDAPSPLIFAGELPPEDSGVKVENDKEVKDEVVEIGTRASRFLHVRRRHASVPSTSAAAAGELPPEDSAVKVEKEEEGKDEVDEGTVGTQASRFRHVHRRSCHRQARVPSSPAAAAVLPPPVTGAAIQLSPATAAVLPPPATGAAIQASPTAAAVLPPPATGPAIKNSIVARNSPSAGAESGV